jgi:hypothetical protein
MRQIFIGAALAIAEIAAFIEAHSHMPLPAAGSSYVERSNIPARYLRPPTTCCASARGRS